MFPETYCHFHTREDIDYFKAYYHLVITPKAPITTAADDKFCDIFTNFRQKKGMILHVNCLPADDSHEISCLFGYF